MRGALVKAVKSSETRHCQASFGHESRLALCFCNYISGPLKQRGNWGTLCVSACEGAARHGGSGVLHQDVERVTPITLIPIEKTNRRKCCCAVRLRDRYSCAHKFT